MGFAASSAQADFTIDLTTKGASGTSNGGIFNQAFSQPTGTGFIDPFVRIHHNEGNGKSGGIERGYNTDGVEEFETKDQGGHNWTHSLLLSDLNVVTIGGTQYFRFSLDTNEQAHQESDKNPTGRHISMNDFRLYLGDAGDLGADTVHSGGTGFQDGFGARTVKVYDIDLDPALGNVTVDINDKLVHPGSGDKDMDVFIPVSLFQGKGAAFRFVYLYSAFGIPPGHPSDDGFEEWWSEIGEGPPPPPPPPPPVIPAPASAVLLLTGLPGLTLAWYRRRRAARA